MGLGISGLQWLFLPGTPVSDVAPLAGLSGLEYLDLRGTQVSDVAPLVALTALNRLELGEGQVDAAGLAALEDLDYTRGRIEVLKSERERMAEQLRMLGLRPLESAANFLFVETLATGRTSGEISERLRERGVAIWDGSKAPGGDVYHCRVTVGDRRQNDRLIEELGEVLASRDGRAAGAPAGR